ETVATPDCTDGQKHCDGNLLKVCESGSWITTDCTATGMICKGDHCETVATPDCTDGQKHCDGNLLKVCESGSWITTDCTATGMICKGDRCETVATPDCADGDIYCDGNMLKVCVAGAWETSDCTASGMICKDDHCEEASIPDCTEGSTYCDGNMLKICVAGAWETTDCSVGEGFHCDESAGACVADPMPHVCDDGTRICSDNWLKECWDNSWKEVDPCICNAEGTDCAEDNCHNNILDDLEQCEEIDGEIIYRDGLTCASVLDNPLAAGKLNCNDRCLVETYECYTSCDPGKFINTCDDEWHGTRCAEHTDGESTYYKVEEFHCGDMETCSDGACQCEEGQYKCTEEYREKETDEACYFECTNKMVGAIGSSCSTDPECESRMAACGGDEGCCASVCTISEGGDLVTATACTSHAWGTPELCTGSTPYCTQKAGCVECRDDYDCHDASKPICGSDGRCRGCQAGEFYCENENESVDVVYDGVDHFVYQTIGNIYSCDVPSGKFVKNTHCPSETPMCNGAYACGNEYFCEPGQIYCLPNSSDVQAFVCPDNGMVPSVFDDTMTCSTLVTAGLLENGKIHCKLWDEKSGYWNEFGDFASDMVLGKCVECASDADCGGSMPYCSNDKCAVCNDDHKYRIEGGNITGICEGGTWVDYSESCPAGITPNEYSGCACRENTYVCRGYDSYRCNGSTYDYDRNCKYGCNETTGLCNLNGYWPAPAVLCDESLGCNPWDDGIRNDPNHCGAWNQKCPGNSHCEDRQCTCDSGKIACNLTTGYDGEFYSWYENQEVQCYDPSVFLNDPNNCGGCGNRCSDHGADYFCSEGVCVDTCTDGDTKCRDNGIYTCEDGHWQHTHTCGEREICNAATVTCEAVACNTDSHCEGETPYCTDHVCVQCNDLHRYRIEGAIITGICEGSTWVDYSESCPAGITPDEYQGCKGKLPYGELCDSDEECQSDFCWNNKCWERKPDGEECTDDEECESRKCDDNICGGRKLTEDEGSVCDPEKYSPLCSHNGSKWILSTCEKHSDMYVVVAADCGERGCNDAGTACEDAECVENATTCDGNTRLVCTSGHWVFFETCPTGTYCETGSCVDKI
ncbi:MAG: hypothetical protein IJM59_06225, partial [Proteobacteria bacterium]|nr:hypothetical protein [Pseudomonadota bacterium]